MKKKLIALLLASSMVFSVTACGGSEEPKEKQIEEKKEKKEEKKGELDDLIGVPLTEAMAKFEELGYEATYFDDGVDFTEFIDSVKDDYSVGELKVDEDKKTVEVDLQLDANTKANEAEEALKEKLSPENAWTAADRYAKDNFGDTVELNYLIGKIAEEMEDENTWFLKCEGKNNGEDVTYEILVTGTNDAPEVVNFNMY